jgi:hypothetical protein
LEDQNIPYKFNIRSCTSKVANDEFLPFETHIDDVEVTAQKDTSQGLIDATAELIQAVDFTIDEVQLLLSYPSGTLLGDGYYQLRFVLDLSDGSTKTALFKKIMAKED